MNEDQIIENIINMIDHFDSTLLLDLPRWVNGSF